jgi:beta-glucosidase
MQKRPRVLVTLDGYAVEGGFDGPHQPATCFTPTIALGRHEGPGAAADLWADYERVLELVPDLGVDGVRMSLEWARIEPRRGVIDDAALARYLRAVTFARGLGLDLVIVLVDEAWPSWLGLEAWLLPWVAPMVVEHARRVASVFRDVTEEMVVFSDRSSNVTRGFVDGTAPPWRRGANQDALRADRNLLAVVDTLRRDDVVGPMLVDVSSTATVGLSIGEITRARASEDVESIFVRSMVAGAGPTGSATGLAVRHATDWVVEADEGLLAALR